ncbi:hypothetical protein AAC387_Pa07g0107 [Persea americana]
MEMEPPPQPDSEPETLTPSLQNLSLSSSDPLSTADPLSCPDLDSLQELACRGSWLALLDSLTRPSHPLQNPHEHLIHLSFQTLALFKLRRFSDAAKLLISDPDLDSALDSDPDSDPDSFSPARYRYETYPKLYPNHRGSMIPFALRFLHADLPHRLGRRSETLDRLYSLLDLARRRSKSLNPNPNNPWKKREIFLINWILGHHLSYREIDSCVFLFRDLIRSDPSNPILLSKLGYVLMQIGDLNGAKSVFDRVEKLGKEEKWFKNLVNRNRALVYMVGKDYVSAVKEYEECIERDPIDAIAINNKALCLMYLRDLSDSIKVLEDVLERAPTAALNETVVVNLCSMYELAYVNNSEIKKTLRNWIARVAPDDFDSSCTRI